MEKNSKDCEFFIEELSFELSTDKEGMDIPENSPLNYEVGVKHFGKRDSNFALIIFVGKGGSLNGYKDKYIQIGRRAEGRFQVFIIENPGISRDDPELYFSSAMYFLRKKLGKNVNYYVMGFSAGGHYVGRFAYQYPEIKQILLINPVLRVDNTKLLKGLNSFKGYGTIIIGDKDPDFFFAPLLDRIVSKIEVKVLPGVDHQFTHEGGLEEFIELPTKYLTGNIIINNFIERNYLFSD